MRKSAQRIIQTQVNSNQYKNFATDYELTATLYYGTSNSSQIQCANTSDFAVTLAEGQELPAGITLNGFVIGYGQPVLGQYQPGDANYQDGWGADNNIYGEYVPQGTYEVLVDMSCDGYITVSDAKLTIKVVSPFQVNGENVIASNGGNPVIEVSQGQRADIIINSKPFAYQAMITEGQVSNWYTKGGTKYLRDEEKVAADLTTIPYSEAEEKHELSYSLVGDLPTGLTAEAITGTAYGLRTHKPFEVVTGIKISGTTTAAPGEYTVTVNQFTPYGTLMWGVYLKPGGEFTVEETFTIVVK